MQNLLRRRAETARIGLWVTLAVAALYCVWLGAHWLPLPYSDKELAAFVSRVWDVQRELFQHRRLPWWTPYYMSGSSYGLNHSQGFYLLPWLLLSSFTGYAVAGKLMALGAIFGSAVAMYGCARHFLRNEWAAALAAVAFLLHPEQIIRAATTEHMGVVVFMPFIPLTWWFFARMLETGRFRDVFWCAVSVLGMMWTHNKQAFVQFVFLAGYLGWWLWPAPRRSRWLKALGLCALTGSVALAIGAFFIVPGLVESRHVKLFYGDPLQAWQRTYSFKSVLGLVDRDGVLTRATTRSVATHLQTVGYRAATPQERAELEQQIRRIFSLPSDAPEKYAGIVLLGVLAVTVLFNHGRAERRLFWFFVAMMLLGFMLACGPANVWTAHWQTFQAMFGLAGVPGLARLAAVAMLAAAAGFLAMFWRRKLTTQRKRVVAGVALGVFLFVPAFPLLAMLAFFREIRAPFVFYDLPVAFFGAMLAGFFVTDVLLGSKWQPHTPRILAGLGALMLLDYWPYQRSMKDNGVPVRTLQNLAGAYGSLRLDPDRVKTYSFSGRYFHLLGPMYGGKPQVYEAFYNWMAPLGTGLLNQQAFASWEDHRAFLDLMNARYVVFDKSDPNNAAAGPQQILASYRQSYPVALENEDFVVFRNESARPYVSAFGRAALFVGDVRVSPRLALALSARNYPLVHWHDMRPPLLDSIPLEQAYVADPEVFLRPDVPPQLAGKLVRMREPLPVVVPPAPGEPVPLSDVRIQRDRADRIRIWASASVPCVVVIAESWYPFWRAKLDGRSVPLYRASCGLMAVQMPAGAHEVELQYDPPQLYSIAAMVSLAALLGCIGLMIWERTARAAGAAATAADHTVVDSSV
jgi:hypothetical protein